MNNTYAEWAAATFENQVIPELAPLNNIVLNQVDTSIWIQTCNPGPGESNRHRLFPGSLFLLWVEVLGNGAVQSGSEQVAAAIELLHNASLVHDDNIDNHTTRKGQPTLLAKHGGAKSLLGGDGLIAAAFVALSKCPAAKLSAVLSRLGKAMENVVAGQFLDEPDEWSKVTADRRLEHWQQVCKGKLSLGNVSASLAAVWTGRDELEAPIATLIEEFSITSQIINDFGDIFDFSGFHTPAPSSRPRAEESSRKPTLAMIWSGCNQVSELEPHKNQLIKKAVQEIDSYKKKAIERLNQLNLKNNNADSFTLLLNYFNSPVFPLPENLNFKL